MNITVWDSDCLGCRMEQKEGNAAEIMLELKEGKDISQLFLTDKEALQLCVDIQYAVKSNLDRKLKAMIQ